MEEFGASLEQTGSVENSENWEISPEAIERIREEERQAKKASQQAKQSRQQNKHYADFLSFLLQHLNNDKLITQVYHVFFKTKHPKTQATFLRKNINNIVIVGIFAPFYYPQIQQFDLAATYTPLYNFQEPINLDKYLTYLKRLSHKYHDNIPIHKWDFLNFLIEIIMHFKLSKHQLTDSTQKEQLMQHLEKELFS